MNVCASEKYCCNDCQRCEPEAKCAHSGLTLYLSDWIVVQKVHGRGG
jgi:hypothetical protein